MSDESIIESEQDEQEGQILGELREDEGFEHGIETEKSQHASSRHCSGLMARITRFGLIIYILISGSDSLNQQS